MIAGTNYLMTITAAFRGEFMFRLTYRKNIHIILTLSILVLIGCAKSNTSGSGGGENASSGVGRCTFNVNSAIACVDYTGSGINWVNAQNLFINTQINSVAGTFEASRTCPSTDEIGRCVVYAGAMSEQTFRYFSSWSSVDAQSDCSIRNGAYTEN